MNWLLIWVVLANLTLSTLSDISIKHWGATNNEKWFFISLALNFVTIFFYMLAIRFGSLSITAPIMLVSTVAISVSLGYFLYHETVSATQWWGLGIGLIALILILDLVPHS